MCLQAIFGACFRRVARRSLIVALALASGALATAQSEAGNNVSGTWSPVFTWTLIPLHVVMTPDARILSYGTKADGTQTGLFIYDLWDTNAGPTGLGHVTLPNNTNTDIFCSSQLLLTDTANSGKVFLSGGDVYQNGATTNTANKNTNIYNPATIQLTRANDMNSPRWYGSSTMLLNGEVYIQGGSSGTARPEVRRTDGTFRPASPMPTRAPSRSSTRATSSRPTVVSSDTTATASCTTSIRPVRARIPARSAAGGQPRHQQRQCGDVPAGPHPELRRRFEPGRS
jgi:hypothetical protein